MIDKPLFYALISLLAGLLSAGCHPPQETGTGAPKLPAAASAHPTFAKEIAPILFEKCASCHRPGQSGPFPLLTYADAKKRSQQIAEVTARRYMPPWLPEPGHGDFVGDRRLTDAQIETIQNWAKEGAKEGDPSDLPPTPKWAEGWQLGKPDLIVKMPEVYMLPASGRDVYRNFVIPILVGETKYVSGVEFRPGAKVVHHAFMLIDKTPGSRRLDAEDPGVGFGGMDFPENASSPDGHFLSWQPGKVPQKEPDGLAWTLEKGSDLVLQVHMQTSGKPEKLQASIGFYFTDQPPAQKPFKIGLGSYALDIPAGKKDYTIKDSYKLPVDVQAMAALPHAHYLGKRLAGYAVLPDGSKKDLLLIKDWDFNWQGDYKYAEPVFLPQGSVLTMEYTYDNSAANVRNPNHPPRRVRYGPNTTDEMGELWLQLLPNSAADYKALDADYKNKALLDIIAYNKYRLKLNPKDAKAHLHLGKALMFQGKEPEAMKRFRQAAQYDPKYDEAHYYMGLMYRKENAPDQAAREFETVVRLNPQHGKAHGNLGLVYAQLGKIDAAEEQFRAALALDPTDTIARESLEELQRARR